MPYSVDWFTKNIPIWEVALAGLKDKPVRALELGTFEGRSAVWLLENILTHENSEIVCVDSWKQNIGFTDDPNRRVDWEQVRLNFARNIEPFISRADIVDSSTTDYLQAHPHEQFDLIYVDASHTAADALTDSVLSHLILKPGGIIIFDDYLWGGLNHAPNVPKGAIDAFMECFAEEYEMVSVGYQVILKKKQTDASPKNQAE